MDDMIDGVLGSIGFTPVKTATPKTEKVKVANLPVRTVSAADELRALEAEKSSLRSRDANEFVGDQVTGLASTFTGLVGGALSLGASGVGALSTYAGAEDLGAAASEFGVDLSQSTNTVTDFIRSGQSDTKAENARINAEMGEIQSAQNAAEYDDAIARGENAFIASLSRIGKDTLDTTARVLSDPLATESVVVDAFGSLGPSAKVASAGVSLATGIAKKMGVQEGKTLAAAEIIGSALGTGAIEGSGTYAQTVGEVMGRTPEEMMTSQMYRDLIAQEVDPLEAQKMVADQTGMDAFELNLPAAIAAGVVSAKFNANPIKAFEGKAMVEGFIEVGAQTLEEMAQGGASQIAQNLAMAENVDNTIRVADGVGEQLALGAIGGAGMSGVIGAVPTVSNAIAYSEARDEQARTEREFVRGMGEQIAAQRRADARAKMTPEERDNELRSGFTAESPGESLYNSVVNKGAQIVDTIKETAQGISGSGAVETVKAGVEAVKTAATPIVNQVIKTAQEYNEKSNPVIQNETLAAAETVSAAVQNPEIETGSLGAPDTSITKDSVPEVFKASVPEGASISDTVTGIVRTLAEKKVPISSMADDAVLFVTQKVNEMQNAASTLAPEVRENIKKVLASPDLERIRKRAARMDLNTTISSTVEKISSTVKTMTMAMSKINPTNVNPDVVDKILKQDDREDLTPEVVRDMQIAASVARPMNEYIEDLVRVEDEKDSFLTSTGQKPKKDISNLEMVSRRLLSGDESNQEKLPSIKKQVNQIIIGMQSPDKTVDIDGVRVPVQNIAGRLRNLVQHMTNKVDALNIAFDQNDEKGVGPTVNFESLSAKTGKFIPVGQAGSGSATYNKRSLNSVTFAKTVGADAAVLAKVYNALVAAYPDQFPDGPVAVPVVKTVETVAESVDQVTDQNTTAVEEAISAPAEIATEQTQEPIEESTPTTVVEDTSPDVSETDEVREKFKQETSGHHVIGDYFTVIELGDLTKSENEVLDDHLSQMSENVGFNVKSLVKYFFNFTVSEGKDFGGMAYESDPDGNGFEGHSLMINRKSFAEDLASLPRLVLHEMGHIFDYSYVKAKGLTEFETLANIPEFWSKGHIHYPNDGVDRADPVEMNEDGAILAEIKAAIGRNQWFANYFKYAMSYSDTDIRSSELFAEMVALYHMYNDDVKRDFPAFSAFYVEVVQTLGGQVEETQTTSEERSIPEDAERIVSKPEVQQEAKLTEKFVSVFRPKKTAAKAKTAGQILSMIAEKPGTEVYQEFAQSLLGTISTGMNERLNTVLFSKADGRTVLEALREDPEKILNVRDFKNMMIVDPETGTYDPVLLDLASMAVIDWMTTARSYGVDRLDDLLEDLGLEFSDSQRLSDKDIRNLLNSVPPRTVTESLAKKVMRLWNVQGKTEAQMVDIRGTTEGLVKEIFTVLSQMEDPLVKVIEIKTGKGEAASFEISGLTADQEAIGMDAAGSLDKVLFPDEQIQASFGEKLKSVPKNQNNHADIPLTEMEQKAIKNMQDTAHTEAVPVSQFFRALGLDAWSRMAGRKDSSQLVNRHPLRLSIEGKNTSIERDYVTAFQMVDVAAGREVYYPVGVTNVGRHQMKGINPQNNKLLRAVITPTHSKLNMTTQKHKDAFWLTVAQSSGLAKVEKKLHSKILATIQQDYVAKFGEATKLIEDWYATDILDQEAFANAMLKATKGEEVSVAQVNAVLAVARLNVAKEQGTLESFETSLSFELDGKTDGPANMMVAFGQGIMTREEYLNFKRVGLFLGSKTETLNTLFTDGEVDLYEVNSTLSTKKMYDMIAKAKGTDKQTLMALQRFAGHFGDFEIKPDGSIVMSRATSKNPMTKKVYGSGEKGIADGIANDMLVGFYTKLTEMADGTSVEDALGYPEINQDLDLLFGTKLPEKLDVNSFILPNERMEPFSQFVKKTLGTILSESNAEVINPETIRVNELLVYITGVQAEFMKSFFDQRIDEAMSELSNEYGDSPNQRKGKAALRKMSQQAYDAIVKETMAFAPYYKDGLQNIRVGSFSGQVDRTEMSSNMDGNIRPKSTMQRPDDLGVKVIPYVIQGRGDAMMMNRIFSADNAPERAVPIFDGIDMAIGDFGNLSDQINEAVLANWDHDVLGPILENFESFLDQIQNQDLGDKLNKAFGVVKQKSDKLSSISALDVSDLREKLVEAVRLNQARKAVFKKITLSVDHMGGSGKSYVRNADGKELSFEEINQMIQDEMNGFISVVPMEVEAPVITETALVEQNLTVFTDVGTVVDSLIRETKKPHIRDAVRAIRTMLADDARIVMGTPAQIAKWRADNLGQGPISKLDQSTKGYYDVNNNIIFIMSDNAETIAHELIHMATFQAVLDHYNGVKKSSAVKNLEVLMDEFMNMDFSKATKKAQQAANAAKAQIIKAQAEATPMGDAVALNEFMAWTLASEALAKELKQTPTGLVAKLTKAAKTWIQKILGVVPLDMYSNILFNTEMIRNTDLPDSFSGGGNNNTNNTNGQVTPPASNLTNFWIDLLRTRLEDAANVAGLDPVDLTKKKATQQKLGKYADNANDALKQLDIGGFALSEYQKKTFIAIHTVIAAELRLDTNALLALGKVYEYVTNNLTPQMFGKGQAAQDRYSAVMELMGASKNDENISDSIAVLLALSQTSTAFRKAMDKIPKPAAQPGIQTSSLNDLLTSTTGFLMQKMVQVTDTEGKGVKEILDTLSDQILRQDDQNEFRALQALMGSFTKADDYVAGALSKLAQRTRDVNRDIQASQTNGVLKTVAGTLTLATSFLSKDTSAKAAKGTKIATHMDGMLDGAVFIRELVAEIVGADAVNTDVIQMLDKVNYVVQAARQGYREELPVILQNEFDTHPTAEQWKDLHHVLGKGDFAAVFDLANPDDSFDMMSDQALLDRRIKDKEKKILKEFPGQIGINILQKSQQLADFMNGKGAGFQLFKNAYAIHKLVGGKKDHLVPEINKLVSLYALNGTDVAQRESVARMQASDPKGVHSLLVYVQALNKEEDQKVISEAARMNGYKGYIPDHGQGEVNLIIARDTDREALEKRGYVRVADDKTDATSLISRGYYMTTVKQGGNYSQGVLQQVQDTYRGVNATTGLTVNGTTSGVISGVTVLTVTDTLNKAMSVNDPKHVLIPVYDQDGGVLYYERAINPDLIQKYLQPDSNMALMVGAWAGRQVEEKFSHEYNKALVDELKNIWDNRESGSEGMFVRMDRAKDKIYKESWEVIPPQLKEDIIATFGEETGFMVRKDMINLALGYRDPSIVDVWTGNNRLPEAVELAVKVAGKATMGDKAYSWLANTESFTQATISTAKDLIVVRSLVVPLMNTQSNVFQLVNRGIGTKQIMKGYREKFVEIDKLNENLKKIEGLKTRILLAATDKNRVAILKQQIQVLEDENKRFSVAPLVEAGAYKNISEGITELDASITDGRFGDWVESKLNKLPAGVQTVAKYGLLSKDTALYRGANKAVQYGDFVAKSIYYDDLTAKGMSHDDAMARVNEEFVNFSLLPGRTRTYLEGMGATWFLTFKIRSVKVALQTMRENPVRSFAMVGILGNESGPITDNVLGKLAEGTLPYSLGWDMLWDAPSMNPWIAATGG